MTAALYLRKGRLEALTVAAVALLDMAGCGQEAALAGAVAGDAAAEVAIQDGTADAAADSAVAACIVQPLTQGAVQKVSALELALAVTGCDRTGDGVPDNALGTGLSQIGGSFNGRLAENLASGAMVMLMAAPQFRSDGAVFSLDLLAGQLGPQHLACAPTASSADCGYQVLPASYAAMATQGICPPASPLSNARIEKGLLLAGGPGDAIVMPLPGAEFALNLHLLDVRLSGKVTTSIGANGKENWLATTDAVLCGVLTKTALFAAIDALPDEQVAARGFSKPVLKATLASFLVPDVAVGGTAANAYSATIRLASVPGHLVP